MNFPLILLLGAAVIWQWKRVNWLEQSISILEFRAAKEDQIETQERPSEAAAVSRPSVPLTRSEEPAEAVRQEAEPQPAEPRSGREPELTSQAAPGLAPEVAQPVEEPSQRFQFDFEDVFGRRLSMRVTQTTFGVRFPPTFDHPDPAKAKGRRIAPPPLLILASNASAHIRSLGFRANRPADGRPCGSLFARRLAPGHGSQSPTGRPQRCALQVA